MKKSNKKLFIIIIVLAVLIVLCGIVLLLLNKTSIKEDFIKCSEQLFASENGFFDNRIFQYIEKRNSSPNENIGKITFEIENESADSKVVDEINNNFSISFAGNTDNANQSMEQLIKINYSEKANFPILYKKVGDMQGIKLNKIMQKYLTTSSINFTDYFQQEQDIDDSSFSISDDDSSFENSQDLKNLVKEVLKEKLEEKSFTKVSSQEEEGYVLNISNEKFKEIIVMILEKLEENENILNKINIPKRYVTIIKNSLNNGVQFDGKTSITLYQKDKVLNRVVFEIDGIMKFDIKKTQKDDEIDYVISVTTIQDNEDASYQLNIGLSGLNDLKTVDENVKLTLENNESRYSINYENKVNFTDISIDKLAENEYVDLDKLSSTEANKVTTLLVQKTLQANINLLKEVGIEDLGNLNSIFPSNAGIDLSGYQATNTQNNTNTPSNNDTQDNTNATNSTNTTTQNTTSNTITTNTANITNTTENSISGNNTTRSELATTFSEAEIKVFNSKYESYVGDNVKGSNVKQLIMNVIANNMADEERQIKVTGVVTLTGNEVPDGIEASKEYKIKLSYSNDGYVNGVEIKE